MFNNQRIETFKLLATEEIPGVKTLNADLFAKLIIEESAEIVADYVNENDMTGLGNYIYLKAYDFAHKLASKQAEHEFENGDLA